ncbi:phenylalanine ammonia-lyase-like protein [Phaeosphaeria sp. MPI-PUGE-AT-0046c]|nr:phenylalanine ammonia-lyase-like protein [Phaeosphaeria sp. MPI-PUGE-AT-0046c]
MASSGTFVAIFMRHWQDLRESVSDQRENVIVEGKELTLASVVATARYAQYVEISDHVKEHVGQNTEQVYGKIEDGEVLYGINTGFGGSANVRTMAIEEIQRGLIRGLHYGILSGEIGSHADSRVKTRIANAKPLSAPLESTTMPECWVRASMLVRLNSLSYGASGVRPVLLERLAQLLNLDIVPRVPLRGSISASGDLSPLSYLGGVLQGKPAVQAWIAGHDGRKLVAADEALELKNLRPIDIRAKEGLALVNGTATSAGVGSLAVHEVLSLAALAQVLTAMSVEALCGTDESFDSFFSEVRPHPGQIECSDSIRAFLSGSQLVLDNTGSQEFSLRQDRYAIRTAPQWIGPVLEDLALAYSQINIEINSVTDNPIIHSSGKMLHGGNFQAKAVTSAMEKTRQGCLAIGQMLFAQCTELINPMTNNGLAPNLVVDEPSQSWMWKGTDILIAALQSELGFLSNPVGHVQSAEMGNQSINSLALISSRYTLTAAEVLAQLAAAHVVALCQALDLRALDVRFTSSLAPVFKHLTRHCLDQCSSDESSKLSSDEIANQMWLKFSQVVKQTTHMDSDVRFTNAMNSLLGPILERVASTQTNLDFVQSWQKNCVGEACRLYKEVHSRYLEEPDAKPLLGMAAKKLYSYVRDTLEVPFFGEKYIREAEWAQHGEALKDTNSEAKYRSMGAMISAVFDAIRNGSLHLVVLESFEEASEQSKST